MKRVMVLLLLGSVALAGLIGCNGQHSLAREHAQTLASAFAEGDMEAINKTVFGMSAYEEENGLYRVGEEDSIAREGMLADIFKSVSVAVGDVTDSVIEYEIEAPDMSGVFDDLDVSEPNLSEDELLDHVRSYMRNAETKKATVSIKYVLVDGGISADYQDEAFVNAVTGGLLDAYKDLYSKMLDEYAEGL